MRPLRLVFALILVGILVSAASAAPKKYHFKLAAVTAKTEVKEDVAKEATKRVEAQVKKAFETHKQVVATLDGAPDPDAKAAAYRKFLKSKGVSGAYLVTVEITEASIEVVPVDDKPNTQRLVVRLAVHFLGENIPGRTMGFTGDGSATIKQEVGKKIRDRDREFTWDEAAKAAVDDALQTVFKQLAAPQKKR